MNEKNSPIREKSYAFSLEIVKCYKHLNQLYHCKDLSRQLLRSATSIGANVEEAQGGQSRKDFVAKMQIAYKEARETEYWLRLLRHSADLEKKKADSLIRDINEILRILNAILNTCKIR